MLKHAWMHGCLNVLVDTHVTKKTTISASVGTTWNKNLAEFLANCA